MAGKAVVRGAGCWLRALVWITAIPASYPAAGVSRLPRVSIDSHWTLTIPRESNEPSLLGVAWRLRGRSQTEFRRRADVGEDALVAAWPVRDAHPPPWRMRRRLRLVHSLAGTMLHTSSSIFTGSVAEVRLEQPREPRHMRVHRESGHAERHTEHHVRRLAPHAAELTRSSIRDGTSPPCRSMRSWLISTIARALERKNPVLWMISSTRSSSAAARSATVGKRAKSAGVTELTFTSVVCALRITETSSCHGTQEVQLGMRIAVLKRESLDNDRRARASPGRQPTLTHPVFAFGLAFASGATLLTGLIDRSPSYHPSHHATAPTPTPPDPTTARNPTA